MRSTRLARRGARSSTHTPNRAGFTLIELMVVVSVVAIVAAMAIPILRSARKTGNEANAIAALRTGAQAEEGHRVRTGRYGTLADMVSRGFIDDTFLTDPRHGYSYGHPAAPDQFAFTIEADPSTPGTTGDRWFMVDETGVIRFSTAGTATPSDAPIGQSQ